MSPTKIPDEKREKHWQMMLALASCHSNSWTNAEGCAVDAWAAVEAHYDFLTNKERENNFIPADDIDEEDGA